MLNAYIFSCYTECAMLKVIMLSVDMLNVIMLSVDMLSVIMLSVGMMSVIKQSVIMLSVVMLSWHLSGSNVIKLFRAAINKLVCLSFAGLSNQV
jgi:hypothetical protein